MARGMRNPREGEVGGRGPSPLAVAGWVSYDLGNTVFSFNIVSLYLPLWVVNDMGGRDSDYGLANSISMGLMFLTAPLLGAISDQAGRRMPYLLSTTCCSAWR